MNDSTRSLLAASLLALGATAFAQAPTGAPAPAADQLVHRGGHHGMRGGDPAQMQDRLQRMQERVARRMAAFKEKLKITPAQEGAWTSWTTAMKPPAQPPRRPDRAEWERLTTPERIDRMKARRAERMALQDRRADATKSFYAALTPEQQKVFDAESMRMRGGRHHGDREGGPRGRHHG